jgi:hypothetical protein
MTDISGFGSVVRIVASRTFPAGVSITQFADDTDGFDLPSVQIADKAMGVNGDLVTWSKANPLAITIAVIPNSDDDRNLAALFNANRVAKGKFGAKDEITMSTVLPDGSSVTLVRGTITDGMPAQSLASAGRLKSKTYAFAFEDVISAGA